MNIKNIQEILSLVERPSQYSGSEINTIRKDHSAVKLRFALAFPDLYEIGTSHFGLQILYHILNQRKDIAAERVFAPQTDMADYLKASDIPLMTLETHTPLNAFDIIGFSLLYELNFTNILSMLDLAKIPFFASQRDTTHPFIIAGGPCTCNPEPVADFFDAMAIGDGEDLIIKISDAWITWKENTDRTRDTLLKMWSEIEGVYIPSFFEPSFESSKKIVSPRFPDYIKVKRTIVNDLNTASFPDTPIVPYGKPVHDRLRLEIARGCTRGCRFCQAGMIYRPVRERAPQTLLALADTSLAATGYEDISLLSLSTGDYRCIVPLMESLMARGESEHVAVSFPSIRAETLTPELMNLVKKVRKTGFTIAPEAGSQRLRDVINKNITEKDISDTVYEAFHLGWQVIKLYFMIGLPTETDEDADMLIDLVKKLHKIKGPGGRKGKINVSVGIFTPKSHTPFQWASQISLDESKDKLWQIQNRLKLPGIQFKWQKPEVSLLEGLWARGDRSLSRLLVNAYKKGCQFDGWSDKFQYHLWEDAFAEQGTDVDFYTTRSRPLEEPLPWDHIDMGVTKDFLKKEWENALSGKSTPDCRDGDCQSCGVCDFETVEPKIFTQAPEISPTANSQQPTASFKKLKLSYAKQGQAKYFGHLEMVKIFLRAIRRAGISVKYSEGFHPMPKISFDDSLPIGMESLNEYLYMTVPEYVDPQTVLSGLMHQLPEGITVQDCQPALGKHEHQVHKTIVYHITLPHGVFNKEKLCYFEESSEFIHTQITHKGKVKKTDLKEMILKTDLPAPNMLHVKVKSEHGKTLRPFEILKAIFELSDEEIKQAEIVKNCIGHL